MSILHEWDFVFLVVANSSKRCVEDVLLYARPCSVVVVRPVSLILFFSHCHEMAQVLVAHVYPSVDQDKQQQHEESRDHDIGE